VFVVASAFCYLYFAYFVIREQFTLLLVLYALLFIGYLALVPTPANRWNTKALLIAGLLFRLVFLITEPNLSQDYYRFIWDGQLLLKGINPYLYTPNELIALPDFQMPNDNALHEGMGTLSARHYSNYPPVNQLFFAFGALVGQGNLLGTIVGLRLSIILGDLGIYYFGRRLLGLLNADPKLIFWYFLNPLVIVELTGNLHFEGIMLCLFVSAAYLVHTKRCFEGALAYAAAIMLKLVPLLFLPLFLQSLRSTKGVFFYTTVALGCLLCFAPFYHPELLAHYTKTIGLWFSNFEFNAALYNLVKYISVEWFGAKPWELIKVYGNVVKLVTLVGLLLLAWRRWPLPPKSIPQLLLFVLATYFFIATTVHPWYLAFLVLLAVFTPYRFPIVWSGTAILSYYAYSQPGYQENLLLIALSYLLVIGYTLFELWKYANIFTVFCKNR
ncbi:MAG: mannosyltransferase, partial [Bacteroidota bacterium]